MALPRPWKDTASFPISASFSLKCEKDEFSLQDVDKSKQGHLRESGRARNSPIGSASRGRAGSLSLPEVGQLPAGIFRAK